MVKTVHLVRHGHHALIGSVLCGRMGGVELDELGRRQILRCAERVTPVPSILQSSPQPRARQSAGILASHFGLPLEIVSAVDEIDFGRWTGRSFLELENDPNWKRWNSRRGTACPPDGESMQHLQHRVVRHLEAIRGDPGGATVLIVSHAEPIRAALMHYANIGLDDFLSVTVEPASVSTLCFDGSEVRISRTNEEVAA
jgi:broad specificity phosphatase PhoE